MDTISGEMNDVQAGCGCPACQYASANNTDPLFVDPVNIDPVNVENGGAPQGINAPQSAVDALLSGAVWANDGTGITISYNFWTSLPSYYSGGDTEASNFQVFNAQMVNATLRVLDMIETFTNITFTQVNDESAQLGFAQSTLDPAAGAWAYYPSAHPKGGDVWTNNMYANTQNPAEGNYGFFVLLHEIGHALGMKHPHDGSPNLPGGEDSARYTVMSYNWPLLSESYMMYDIAALQQLYGVNATHNSGNTNYALKSGAGYTIWDTGGTDTLDGSLITTDMTLDLREGSLSSVGHTDNIGIAYNVVIENANGGTGNDTFYGNAVNNIIMGGNGDDVFYGSDGDDTLNGQAGNDTVIYSLDISNFTFSIDGATTITATDSSSTFGSDTLINFETFNFNGSLYTFQDLADQFGSPEVIRMVLGWTGGGYALDSGETGSFNYTADALGIGGNHNALSLTRGVTSIDATVLDPASGEIDNMILRNDTLTDVTLTGYRSQEVDVNGSTSDVSVDIQQAMRGRVTTGSGADTINVTLQEIVAFDPADVDQWIIKAGSGDDQITVDGTITNMFGSIYGGDGNDQITMLVQGNDRINGDGGNDVINAGLGNDRAYGGTGDDTLNGGTGDDWLYGQNDTDILNGQDGADFLSGGSGDDQLFGDAGNDILLGDTGADTLNGGDGLDILKGGAGDDILNGGADNDRLYGGNNNDTLRGGDGNDQLNGEIGDDQLFGDAGNDKLYGLSGADTLYGGDGRDSLYGGNQDDILYGGLGDDRLYGNFDNDTLYGEDGHDYLLGGGGNDTLDAGDGDDTLYGQGDNDILLGGAGIDMLNGGDGNDRLDGGADRDLLYAGSGTDILIGGDGADRMHGGAGQDTFALTTLDASAEWIYSFTNGEDILNITDILIGYDALNDDIADFVRIVDLGSSTDVRINADGLGGTYGRAAIIYTDLHGATAQDLLNNGTLVADLSV